MPQLNDCILTATGGAQINDALLTYYLANGAVSNILRDAEYEFLIARGIAAGQLNDMWFSYLTAKGYSGALNDMLYEFWCVNNGVP